jgi:hypothetical protein
MVRRGRWKLHAYHPVAGIQPETVYKLFDMESDPREERDLASSSEQRQTLDQLKDDLVSWLLSAELLHAGRGGTAVPRKDQLIKNAVEFDAVPVRGANSDGRYQPGGLR